MEAVIVLCMWLKSSDTYIHWTVMAGIGGAGCQIIWLCRKFVKSYCMAADMQTCMTNLTIETNLDGLKLMLDKQCMVYDDT